MDKKINSTSKSQSNFSTLILPFIVVVLIVGYIALSIYRPIPELTATTNDITSPSVGGTALVWPIDVKQSAFGSVDGGIIATNGSQESQAIASIAKSMVALAVLEKMPLQLGEQGPLYAITQSDLDLYKEDLAQNGSVVPVKLNDQLTEYQLLQALMLPSGDNIATTLAIWGFGSLENYLNYANQKAKEWGMNKTNFADASGLSPQTVSTASDLVILGQKVMREPALAEIVNQSEVTLPVAGTVKNYNTILGTIGDVKLVGIKTGNTDEAGGCFLYAAKNNISGQEITTVGAFLGAASRNQALLATKNFISKNYPNFKTVTVVKAGQNVGNYKSDWGQTANVIAKEDLNILVTTKDSIVVNANLKNQSSPIEKNSEVGTVTAKVGNEEISVPAIIDASISNPSLIWKLSHPFR